MTTNLTEEQRRVIQHPLGRHARVLAVAGSGKTTTMAHRVKHLVLDLKVDPRRIRILMFNRLAKLQFKEKLAQVGLREALRPQVHTFHSFSYNLINLVVKEGLHPPYHHMWIEDKVELARIKLHEAIRNLEKCKVILPNTIDIEEAMDAISLWKGALIPAEPDRAGYHGNDYLPLVYAEFESIRTREGALTFDDFVPVAVTLLTANTAIRQRYASSDFVIADEYQDVNYGQQRLIELLTGKRADVMVVGDDDQVVYEWRGARPNYILREFRETFDNKLHDDYTLSRSFRFGPVLAQCAANVIVTNNRRMPKKLVANKLAQQTLIHVFTEHSEQMTDPNKELAGQAAVLIREYGERAKTNGQLLDLSDKIIVLGRLFAQLDTLEAAFLTKRIPYRVVGKKPFFERHEVQTLLTYLQLAIAVRQPLSEKTAKGFLAILNTPNRKVSRASAAQVIDTTLSRKESLADALESLSDPTFSQLSRDQRTRLDELFQLVLRLNELVTTNPPLTVGRILQWLVEALDYRRHFVDYYGKVEESYDRWMTVDSFLDYANDTRLTAAEFLKHVAKLDTTRGVAEAQQVVMTTVYRTKGLEYANVFIPNCNEGYMPYTHSAPNQIFDKAGIVREQEASDVIENERRLLYVAITRGIKQVFISTSHAPMLGQQGNSQASLPSRFLGEMEWEATHCLLASFQKVYSGDEQGRAELFDSAKKYGGSKKAIAGLLRDYLPQLQDPVLTASIETIADSVLSVSIEAPRALVPTSPKPMPEKSEPEWWTEL